MTEQEEQQLIATVRTLSDHMTMVDAVFSAARIGVTMVPVYQCGESGLYYPGDYITDWGKKYGIGLGPHPVSEALQSEYDIEPPAITEQIRSIDQIMHPVRASSAQMDLLLVDSRVVADSAAIVALEDEHMERRRTIILAKQRRNPRSKIYDGHNGQLNLVQRAWSAAGKAIPR